MFYDFTVDNILYIFLYFLYFAETLNEQCLHQDNIKDKIVERNAFSELVIASTKSKIPIYFR